MRHRVALGLRGLNLVNEVDKGGAVFAVESATSERFDLVCHLARGGVSERHARPPDGVQGATQGAPSSASGRPAATVIRPTSISVVSSGYIGVE